MQLETNRQLRRNPHKKFRPLQGREHMQKLEQLRGTAWRRGLLRADLRPQPVQSPQRSRLWDHEVRAGDPDNVYLVTGHAAACGGVNSRGNPIKKTFQNGSPTPCKELAGAVSRKSSLKRSCCIAGHSSAAMRSAGAL